MKMLITKLLSIAMLAVAVNGYAGDISFGDVYTFEDVSTSEWSERELKKYNLLEMGTGTAWLSAFPGAVGSQYALFEVRGATLKSVIRPEVENLGFKGTLEVSVWSDAELRNKAMPPLSTKNDWETDGRWIDLRQPGDISGPLIDDDDWMGEWDDDYILEYENEDDEIDFEWPADMWPDDKAVAGRFWVAVKCTASEKNRWYGIDGAIRVRLAGTDVKSPMMYVGYSTDDTWPFSTNASGLFRGLTINTKFTAFCPDVWNAHQASYDAPLHSYWLETSWNQGGGGPLSISLPEAGILYFACDWYSNMGDINIKNANSVSVDDVEETDSRTMYFEYGGQPWPFSRPRVISARVNAAKTITITRDEDDDDDYDFNRLQFFPSSKKAVAVEASFYSILDKNIYPRRSDHVGQYLQGYVTGTGVYKVGETVALKAVPAPGEAFDHWELSYGNFPAGMDTTKATLNFTVTDACAGTAEERKQMVVRAVWKPKQQLIVTPADISKGVVTGSGFYLDGTSVTLTAKANNGYVFAGWYSDEGCTMPLEGGTDYRNPSYSYTTTDDDVTLVAKFVTKAEDMAISVDTNALAQAGEINSSGLVSIDVLSAVASLTVPNISNVKGLPKGVTYNATTGKIEGKATETGVFNVSFTVANSSVKGETKSFAISIPSLSWTLDDSAPMPGGFWTITSPDCVWQLACVPTLHEDMWVEDYESASQVDLMIAADYWSGVHNKSIHIEDVKGKYEPVLKGAGVLTLPETVVDSEGNTYSVGMRGWSFEDYRVKKRSITKLLIPSTWTAPFGVGNSAFGTIEVAEGNPVYRSEDGVLISGTELLMVPGGYTAKTYRIPNGITKVASGALETPKIDTIVIGPDVQEWGSNGSDYSKNIVIDNNPNFVYENGLLMSDYGATLVDVLWNVIKGKDVVLPSSIQYLAEGSLGWGPAVSSIVATSENLTVDEDVFEGCSVNNAIDFSRVGSLTLKCGRFTYDDFAVKTIKFPANTTFNSGVLNFEGYATTLADIYWPTLASQANSGLDDVWIEESKNAVKLHVRSDAGYWPTKLGDVTVVKDLYPVAFDLNDSNGVEAECDEDVRFVAYNQAIGALPTPVRAGYQFDGWYTEAFGGTKVTATTKVTGDVTYYAHWSAAIIPVVMPGCEGMGKVSGGGVTASGKTATLTATANKGYVFAGWYDEYMMPLSGEYRATSYKYVSTGEPVQVVARFVSAEEDSGITINLAASYQTEANGSCELDVASSIESLSCPKITVTGLPTGLKFDANTCIISGKATKPGVYPVTVKVTNATVTRTPATATFTLTVPNLHSKLFDDAGIEDSYDFYGGYVSGMELFLGELGGFIAEGWTISASGQPSGLTFKADAKTGVATFTGVASKEGTSTVTFTASKRGEATQTATATVNVFFPTLSVTSSDETMGTVTGGGKYPAGKVVTLKATAKKGYVFAGWYDVYGTPLESATDFRTASYPYVTTADNVEITGYFVSVEEDAAEENISFTFYTADLYPANEEVEEQIEVGSYSLPTVSAANLPTGLKFDAKTLKITGKPTKPGEIKEVTFTIKNQSNKTGKKETRIMRVGDSVADDLNLLYNTIPGEDGYPLIVPGTVVDEDLLGIGTASLVGWTVSGLPAGITFDGKTGKFGGKATQSGKTYLVTLTKGTGAAKQTATISLGTKPDPRLSLHVYLLERDDFDEETMDAYTSQFVLTGGGNYQVGKKVTISATAPKNWVFIGWARIAGYSGSDVILSRFSSDAKATFEMIAPEGEDNEVDLVAVFTHVVGDISVPIDHIE